MVWGPIVMGRGASLSPGLQNRSSGEPRSRLSAGPACSAQAPGPRSGSPYFSSFLVRGDLAFASTVGGEVMVPADFAAVIGMDPDDPGAHHPSPRRNLAGRGLGLDDRRSLPW